MTRNPMNHKEWQQAMDAAAKLLDNEAARRVGRNDHALLPCSHHDRPQDPELRRHWERAVGCVGVPPRFYRLALLLTA